MIARLRVLIITFLTFMLFVSTVFLELIAGIAAYMILRTDENTFGYLVSFSRNFMNTFSETLETFFPTAANQANATLLGEMSPKAILLLLLGLTVGALLRFVFWGCKCIWRRDVTIG